MKKAKVGFGHKPFAIGSQGLNGITSEDCKALCSRNKACASVRYCEIDGDCNSYLDAPSKGPDISPLSDDCTIYVKSCGNFNWWFLDPRNHA